MKKLEIEIPDGCRAEWVNGVLTLVEEKPQDITERIKTFEDAYKWCNKNHKSHLTGEYEKVSGWLLPTSDLLAYLKLRIITAALNEGWEPTEEDPGWMPRWLKSRYCDLDAATCHDYLGNYAFKLGLKSKELAVYAKEQFPVIYADFCGCKKGGGQ